MPLRKNLYGTKSYQRKVIENLEEYLDYIHEQKSIAKSFYRYKEENILLIS